MNALWLTSLPSGAGDRWRLFRPRRPWTVWGSGLWLPLVNVVLVVGLFVVLDARFVLQPGIGVRLPAAEGVTGAPYGALVVTLTQEGLVFFNDERRSLETLAFDFQRAGRAPAESALTIEADARVPYGTVVRVMDMAMAAGVRHIHLAARPAPAESLMP